MKTRNGWVSNSSSCSFIIKKDNFRAKKYTLEEIKTMLHKLVDVSYEFDPESDFGYGEYDGTLESIMDVGVIDAAKHAELKSALVGRYGTDYEWVDDKMVKIHKNIPKYVLDFDVGDYYIESAADNSIPYFIMQYIEFNLGGGHHHWG